MHASRVIIVCMLTLCMLTTSRATMMRVCVHHATRVHVQVDTRRAPTRHGDHVGPQVEHHVSVLMLVLVHTFHVGKGYYQSKRACHTRQCDV